MKTLIAFIIFVLMLGVIAIVGGVQPSADQMELIGIQVDDSPIDRAIVGNYVERQKEIVPRIILWSVVSLLVFLIAIVVVSRFLRPTFMKIEACEAQKKHDHEQSLKVVSGRAAPCEYQDWLG